MARASRDTRLENRSNRLKLKLGTRFYVTISAGLSLVYRRPGKGGSGSWSCRVKNTLGNDRMIRIGSADDHQDADGQTVFTYSQAQERCRLLAKESLTASTGKPTTFQEAADRYLVWYEIHRRAFRETQTTVNAHILPYWGNKLIIEISTPEIRRWHEKLAATPARKRSSQFSLKIEHREKPTTHDEKRARKSTANRILTVYKAILNKAFQDDLVSDDTAWRRIKPFEHADEPVIRFLTVAECALLVNSCPPHFRSLVKAALFTGCRYGELVRLLVKEVNLDTQMVYISPESKNGKGRHIPLHREGLDFFRSCTQGKTGEDHVFLRSDGKPWGKNHQVRLLKTACAQAKIEPGISFHELRHTYASTLAQLGTDLLTISKLLGHADTRITARHYAHLCDNTLKTAVAKLPGFGHQPDAKISWI